MISARHCVGITDRDWPTPVDLLGMPVHPVRFDQAVDLLLALAHGDQPAYAVTANVDHVVRFARHPEIRHLYERAHLVLADGTPLVWASRLLGRTLPERVAGSDLFPALCARAAEQNLSIFLLGGAPGTARRAAQTLQARHLHLRVVGTCCPNYGFEKDPSEASRVVDAVITARPDILFVGLGSPKQENWIVENMTACGAKLNIGVGISFSFVCGDVARAPRWMQQAGLEWLHRLCQEPTRLWKRYLVDDSQFFALLMCNLIKRQSPRGPRQISSSSQHSSTEIG